jgi:hypothetical protein
MNRGIAILFVSVLLTGCLGKVQKVDSRALRVASPASMQSPGSSVPGTSNQSTSTQSTSTNATSTTITQPALSVLPGSSASEQYRKVDLVLVLDDTDEADPYRARLKRAVVSLGDSLLRSPDVNTCIAIVLASRAWRRQGTELVIGCSKPSNAESLSPEQLNSHVDAMMGAAINFIPTAGETIKAPLGKALVAFLYNSFDWDYFKANPSSTLRSFFRKDALTHFHFFSHMNNWRQINPATLLAGQEFTGAWHLQERRIDLPMVRNAAFTILGNDSQTTNLGWSASWPTIDSRKGYKEYLDESLSQLKGGSPRYSVSTMMTQYDENDFGLQGCYQGINNRAQNMKNLASVVQNGSLEGNIQSLSGNSYESFYQNLGQSLISRSVSP